MQWSKTCKFCKHGYPQCTKDGMTCWCYLSMMNPPVKKDPEDTCQDWELDGEFSDDEE